MNQSDAAQIKAASGLPVFCVGGWQTAGRIRQALEAGDCDVVSIARGLLANPDMVQRFAEGQHAPSRPCTYCNKCLVNALLQPLACGMSNEVLAIALHAAHGRRIVMITRNA